MRINQVFLLTRIYGYDILNIGDEKTERVGYMLNEEICKARKKLEESIIMGEDSKTIYKLSTELDKLIAKYYLDLKK